MRVWIHPLFFIVAFVAVFFSAFDFFIALTIAVIFHEGAHGLVAKSFGVGASRVTLMPFGGVINLNTNILTSHQKCLIYLAGPVASLLFSLLFGVLVWIFPTFFIYLEYLVVANFLVGLINLLPVYPLDGGKILSQYVSSKTIYIWSDIVFFIVLVISLVNFNWWWIFFSITVLLQINWDFKQTTYVDKFTCHTKQKTGKLVRYAVISNMTLLSIYKMIDKKHPTEFVVTDRNNISFYENDLENWLTENQSNTRLVNCLK